MGRREKHQARLQALNAMGRTLSRRARSHCELCGEGGRSLQVTEVAGGPEEPTEEWALMLCARCQDLDPREPETLRFLEQAVWSETRPAQILAVRHLRALAEAGVGWAMEANDGLWLPDEVAELI